jgi:hypothetical protein
MEKSAKRRSTDDCDDPDRLPASPARIPDSIPLNQADLRKSLRADERRALAWFVVMIVTFAYGAVVGIGAVGTTVWSTWMTNWQSNLSFYFSLVSLVFAAKFGLRSASTLRKLKAREERRSDGRD